MQDRICHYTRENQASRVEKRESAGDDGRKKTPT